MEEVLPSAMGRLLEKEITSLNQLLKNPEKPCIFILGGAKIQDAFLMMDSILRNNIADLVLATGLVAQVMLLAQSISLGKSSKDIIKQKNLEGYIEQSKDILDKYESKIKLPLDLAYSITGKRKEINISSLPIDDYPLSDIGSNTITEYEQIIKDAKTIFFN